MINIYPSSAYNTCFQGLTATRVVDLESVLSISDIKHYLKIDADYTVDDNLISELREGNVKLVEEYLNRSLTEQSIIANYTSVSKNILLPLGVATSVSSITVDDELLTVDDDYILFAGKLQFKNLTGYNANIVITYTSSSEFKENIKTVVKRLIGIDYNNDDTTNKQTVMRMLRGDKLSGWL